MSAVPASENYKHRTGHFILHWGVPGAIHPQPDLGGQALGVLEFSPNRRLTSWRYATNGMSELPQECDGRKRRTELYAISRAKAPWLIPLLDAMARHPFQEPTYLSECDTLPLVPGMPGVPPQFGGILLAPPDPPDPATLGAFTCGDGATVLVHQVVLITPSEMEFAIASGGETLWKRLVKLDQPLLADRSRPAAV